jgi:heme-degrading monooxygenase HmoA
VAETYTSGSWTAKPGQEDSFVAAWTQFAQWISGQPGVGTLRLVRDLEAPQRFLSFAPWEGIDSIRSWKALPEFRERIGRVKEHVDDFTAAELELVVAVERGAAVSV